MITKVEFDGIKEREHPTYWEAFITYAERDGKPLTDEEIRDLNENRGQEFEDLLMEHLHLD